MIQKYIQEYKTTRCGQENKDMEKREDEEREFVVIKMISVVSV